MSVALQIETALANDQGVRAAEQLLAQGNDLPERELREVGEAVARQYHEFHVHPVHQFYARLEQGYPAAAYQAVYEPIKADFEATREWDRRLDEIAGERLVNGLVDHVKSNNMAEAENAAISLITSVPEEVRPQRARFIGNILGGLTYEKDRAQGLLKQMSRNPVKFGLDPVSVTDVEEEFARGAANAARRERSAANAGRQNLTEATVELGRRLPGRNVLHAPQEEEIQTFDRAVRAILRSCLLSPSHDKFNEATMLIVEFSPKEVSTAGSLAGVEERLYGTLGRTARLVADRVFQTVGRHPNVINPYISFARQCLARRDKVGHYTVEVMGVFKNPDAVPFLKDVLRDKNTDSRREALFALGALGTEDALNDLLAALKKDTSAKIIEGEARREAFNIISALGRTVRSISDMSARSRVISQVIAILPKDDLEFPVRTALNFFTGKQDGADPDVLRWAAQVAVTALWSSDRPELARAGRSQPMGFRQPLLDLMGRLAPFAMTTINETAEKYAKLYSGAYLAMGEFYAKYPDPSQVPVIKQMLFNTALHDDTKKSEYVKQTVYDAASESQQELTKDAVIASLAGALDKIDSDEARQAMADLFQQVQSGQLPQPGPETSAILLKAYMLEMKKSGKATLAKDRRRPAPAAGAPAATPGVVGDDEPLMDDLDVEPTHVTDDDLQLIESLNARYLMASKRRSKKVAALNALAQRKITPALQPMIAHVADSDLIIASAAQMALNDFIQPPIARQTRDAFYDQVLDAIDRADNAVKVKLGEILTKLGVQKSPLKEKIAERMNRGDMSPAGRAVLEKAMGAKSVAAGTTHSRETVSADPDKLGAAASYMPKAGGDKAADYVSDMDKKRAYLQARQEWIRGGKRGPEPTPPE